MVQAVQLNYRCLGYWLDLLKPDTAATVHDDRLKEKLSCDSGTPYRTFTESDHEEVYMLKL